MVIRDSQYDKVRSSLLNKLKSDFINDNVMQSSLQATVSRSKRFCCRTEEQKDVLLDKNKLFNKCMSIMCVSCFCLILKWDSKYILTCNLCNYIPMSPNIQCPGCTQFSAFLMWHNIGSVPQHALLKCNHWSVPSVYITLGLCIERLVTKIWGWGDGEAGMMIMQL